MTILDLSPSSLVRMEGVFVGTLSPVKSSSKDYLLCMVSLAVSIYLFNLSLSLLLLSMSSLLKINSTPRLLVQLTGASVFVK